uniref:Uncharacterized protein n=1 Tax=Physcomitrium patens TaxID=3218 RepID=A0A7I4FTP9_PHYPA
MPLEKDRTASTSVGAATAFCFDQYTLPIKQHMV